MLDLYTCLRPNNCVLTRMEAPNIILKKTGRLVGEEMATIPDLRTQYESLDRQVLVKGEDNIEAECLLVFDYEYVGQASEVSIDTDEFTAVCPWTGLPDYGNLMISYLPNRHCIELKSLKYYLLSFRDVGIVQEHAVNRILNDLVAVCQPISITVTLDYKVRGGIHTVVTSKYPSS